MPTIRTVRRFSLLLLPAFALLVFAIHAPAVRADEDNGCDPTVEVACIELPPAPAEGDDAPATASGDPRPSIAAPLPPLPCPPSYLAPADAAGPAITIPLPRECPIRDVVAAINRANVVYVTALSTWDAAALGTLWGGRARADLEAQIRELRRRGAYATPKMLRIVPLEVSPSGASARVRTLEHWIYQERARLTGHVLYEDDQWVENFYGMRLTSNGWQVVTNSVTLAEPPHLPAPVMSIRVTTDRSYYRDGDNVVARVMNTGSVRVYAAGGYNCGLVRVEQFTDTGWRPAPMPDTAICTLVAEVINPGESRTHTLLAGVGPGVYRLVFRYSSDAAQGNGVAYSDPYIVN